MYQDQKQYEKGLGVYIITILVLLLIFEYQGELGWNEKLAFVPADFWAGQNLYSTITYALLHSSDDHLKFNLIVLLGTVFVIAHVGMLRCFLVALLACLVGIMFHAVFFPESKIPIRGISNVAAAVWVFGFWLHATSSGIWGRVICYSLAILFGICLSIDMFKRFNLPLEAGDTTAHGHFGGLIVGVLAIVHHEWKARRRTDQ